VCCVGWTTYYYIIVLHLVSRNAGRNCPGQRDEDALTRVSQSLFVIISSSNVIALVKVFCIGALLLKRGATSKGLLVVVVHRDKYLNNNNEIFVSWPWSDLRP